MQESRLRYNPLTPGLLVSLFSVTTGKETEFQQTVIEKFKEYFNRLIQTNQTHRDSIYKNSRKSVREEFVKNKLYSPLSYFTWGNFDIAFLSLIDDFEIIHKLATLPGQQAQQFFFGSPISCSRKTGDYQNIRAIFDENFHEKYPITGICQMKFSPLWLSALGTEIIRDFYINNFPALRSKFSQKGRIFLLHSFSWSELTFLLFSQSIKEIVENILSLRELTVEEGLPEESIQKLKERKLAKQFFGHSSKYDFKKSHIFTTTYTTIGFNFEVYKALYEEGEIPSEVNIKEEQILAITRLGGRPGHLKTVSEIIAQGSKISYPIIGKHDFIIGNKLDSSLLSMDDILKWEDILESLKEQKTPDKKRIWELFDKEVKKIITKWKYGKKFDKKSKQLLINGLNKIIKNREFYSDKAFNKIELSKEATNLLRKGIKNLSENDVQKFNRLLLETIYPQEIAKSQKSIRGLFHLISTNEFLPAFVKIRRNSEKHIYSTWTDVAIPLKISTKTVSETHKFVFTPLKRIDAKWIEQTKKARDNCYSLNIPKNLLFEIEHLSSMYYICMHDLRLLDTFIDLYPFVQAFYKFLIGIKKVKTERGMRLKYGKNNIRFSEVIEIIKTNLAGFKEAFENRYLQSYAMNEITDFTFEYRGSIYKILSSLSGIQKALLALLDDEIFQCGIIIISRPVLPQTRNRSIGSIIYMNYHSLYKPLELATMYHEIAHYFFTTEWKEIKNKMREILRKLIKGSSLLSMDDILKWEDILESLKEQKTPDKKRIWELFDKEVKKIITKWKYGKKFDKKSKQLLINGLNKIIKNREFYSDKAFNKIELSKEATNLLRKGIKNLSENDVQKFNRLLLETIYPQEIAKSLIKKDREKEAFLEKQFENLEEIFCDMFAYYFGFFGDTDLFIKYMWSEYQYVKPKFSFKSSNENHFKFFAVRNILSSFPEFRYALYRSISKKQNLSFANEEFKSVMNILEKIKDYDITLEKFIKSDHRDEKTLAGQIFSLCKNYIENYRDIFENMEKVIRKKIKKVFPNVKLTNKNNITEKDINAHLRDIEKIGKKLTQGITYVFSNDEKRTFAAYKFAQKILHAHLHQIFIYIDDKHPYVIREDAQIKFPGVKNLYIDPTGGTFLCAPYFRLEYYTLRTATYVSLEDMTEKMKEESVIKLLMPKK